ncbi:hypothetical protein [Streptomyces sp. NPDC059247]|uniref:hypothetical protein n=1 Tax=Streptomyces sp. NPDC059247 TaxID=3346790 RepID=UPI0036B22543
MHHPTTASGHALAHAQRMDRFYSRAAALGADRERADDALRRVQGRYEGSSATAEECDAAVRLLAADCGR